MDNIFGAVPIAYFSPTARMSSSFIRENFPFTDSAWSMVACAAALGIRMEKAGVYVMGKGEMPTVGDITRCYHLVELTSVIFIICVTLPLYAFIGIDIQLFFEGLIIKFGGMIL